MLPDLLSWFHSEKSSAENVETPDPGLRPGLSSAVPTGLISSRGQVALVGSFGAGFLEAIVEGLAALEAGFHCVPVVDFCFA
jgi:hypothetical protein